MLSQKILAAIAIITLSSAPVLAADVPVTAPVSKPTAKAKANPYLPQMQDKAREIGAKLDKQALTHLYYVREGFGVLRAVTMVRDDVGNAVTACGKANPDLKKTMDDRFAAWKGAVEPVMQGKENDIDAAVQTQTYMPPAEIKDYLHLIDKTADFATHQVEKHIVTTPEACNGLLASMDRTQETVAGLLKEIKILPWLPAPLPEEKPVVTPN